LREEKQQPRKNARAQKEIAAKKRKKRKKKEGAEIVQGRSGLRVGKAALSG
jgi:hypothetical protein